MPEPEFDVELVARYRVAADDHRTYPWADGSLMIVHDEHSEAGSHRYYITFMDKPTQHRAWTEMRSTYKDNPYTKEYAIALEIPSLEFVGFLKEDGSIVDAHGSVVAV